MAEALDEEIWGWDCSICFDGYDDLTIMPIVIGEDTICLDCGKTELAERFKEALNNEFEPARWGDVILDANDFKQLFDEEFLEKWNAAKREREVPLKKRVYCRHQVPDVSVEEVGEKLAETKLDENDSTVTDGVAQAAEKDDKEKAQPMQDCGRFIGAKSNSGVPVIVSCNQCRGLVCRSCKAAIAKDQEHSFCNAEASPTAEELFTGMKRGYHYQLCPKCGLKNERTDGCNHMGCPSCFESFCAICGVVAAADSGHWKRTVSDCPKYNHPDDDNAVFEDDEGGDGFRPRQPRNPDEEDEQGEADSYFSDTDEDFDRPLITALERGMRRRKPDEDLSLFDDVPITNEMFDAAPLDSETRTALICSRRFYFLDMYLKYKERPPFWPQEYRDTYIECYRILRMLIQLDHSPPSGREAEEALEKYRGYWAELNRLRESLTGEWNEREDIEIQEQVEACEASRERVEQRLQALAQS